MRAAAEQASAESPLEIGEVGDAGTTLRLAALPPTDSLALTRSVVGRLPRPSAREIRDLGPFEATRSRTRTDSMGSTRSSVSSTHGRNSAGVGELITQLQRLWQRQRFRADERAFSRDMEKIITVLRRRAPTREDGYTSGSGGESHAVGLASVASIVPIEAVASTSRQDHEEDSVSDADSSSDDGSSIRRPRLRAPRSTADESVELLVDAMDPLFHNRYPEVRTLAFEVTCLCLTHYGNQLSEATRRLVFNRLQDHDQGGDFEPRQRTLRILTNDGRYVQPFQDDLGWLLIDWLEESNEQRELLNLIQSILRRSPLSLNFDSVIAITSVICGRCDVAWSRGDMETCKRYLAFFHVLATHRLERALGTSVCLRTLCWMVNADGHGTWSVMKHLLNSSAGFQVLRGLVTLLENPMQYNQWVLRGAVFFVGMSCWGSQRVTKLDEIKWAPILLALEACLECDNGVVIFEVILAIQRLVKKYGDKNGQTTAASDTLKPHLSKKLLVEWDIILRMLRTLQPWLSRTHGTVGQGDEHPGQVQHRNQQSDANEDSADSSVTKRLQQPTQLRTDVPVHMTRIPKELLDTLQVVVDLVREDKFSGDVEEFYDVLQEYLVHLPESAARLLLQYRALAAHPAHHADWLHTLEDTMATFFMNREAPPAIRLEALELLQVNLWSSRNVSEDRVIEEVLLPMLSDVYLDPESTIRRKALDLITEVARTLESVRFESLLDILDNAVHLSTYGDSQICAMSGIVSLFSSYFNHLPQSRSLRMYGMITSAVESHRNWQVRHCALECLLKVCEASSDYRLQWRESQVRTSRFLFCSRRAARNQQAVPVSHGLRALLTRISTETHSTVFRMAVEGLRRMLCNRLILADIDISDVAMKVISYVDYHAFGRAAIPDEVSSLIAEFDAENTQTSQATVSPNDTEAHNRSSMQSRQSRTAATTRINPVAAKSNLHEASMLLCKTRFTMMGLQILELFVSYIGDLDAGTRHHLMICCIGVLATPLVISGKDLEMKNPESGSPSPHNDSQWIWPTRGRTMSVGRSRAASVSGDDPKEQTASQSSSHTAVNSDEAKVSSPQMAFTSRVFSKFQSSTHNSSLFNVLAATHATEKRLPASDGALRTASGSKTDREAVVKCLRRIFDSELELLRTAVNTISLLGHIMPNVIMANLDMLLHSAKVCFHTPEGDFRADGHAAVIEMIGNLIVNTPDIRMQFEHKAQILHDFVLLAFRLRAGKATCYLAYRVLCEIIFRCERREDRISLATNALPLLSEYSNTAATSNDISIIEAAIDFLTSFALSRSDIIPAPALRVTSPDDNFREDQVVHTRSSRSWVHHNAIVSIESCSGKPSVLVVRRANSTTKWHLAMRQPYIVQEPTGSKADLVINFSNIADGATRATASRDHTKFPTEQVERTKTGITVPPRPPAPSRTGTKLFHSRQVRATLSSEPSPTSQTAPSHVVFSPHHLPVPPLPAYDGIGGSPSFFRDATTDDRANRLAGMERFALDDSNPVKLVNTIDEAGSGDNSMDEDEQGARNQTSSRDEEDVLQPDLSVSPTITEESDGALNSSAEPQEDEATHAEEQHQPAAVDASTPVDLPATPEDTDSLFLMMQLFDSNMEGRPQILAEGASLTLGLSILDRTPEFETHKIGVLYWRSGKQQAEVDILGNFGGSVRYLNFLRTLGSVTRLEGLHGFSGGMDTSDQHSDGKYMLLYRSHSLQMVFHVATMMTPYEELDDESMTTPSQQGHSAQTIKKKRLIGNDFVHIVFKECDDDYDVHTFSGQFNDVHIIVQPLNDHEYRTQVKCKPGIAPFGPLHGTQVVPAAVVAQCVRQTCLNANLACQAFHQEAIGFTMNCEERLKQIKQLGARHATVSDEWTLLRPPTSQDKR